jgi:hypothetical protein
MYPAPHPAPPQVISGPGSVLAAPKIVPVFFPNDAFQAQLVDFASKVGATNYWKAASMEYGVGAASSLPPVVLTEAAPATIDDSAIQTWLAGKLNGNDAMWPAPDANTIYVVHFPATTTITLQSGQGASTSCQEFGGYHDSIALDATHGSMNVAYAVVPRCSNFGGLQGVDAVTGAESHELLEAATDPFPMVSAGYGTVDDAHLYWEFVLGGGEVGDMCAQFPGAFTKFPELPYTVQRSWSNAAVKAGHDPCVPALAGQVYFNAVPVLPDNLSFPGVGTMKAVSIPVGQTKTIDLDLYSDGDTGGPFTVDVQDFGAITGQAPTLNVSLDRSQGQNGEKLHLTITTLKKNQYGASAFIVTSTLGSQKNWWFGLVSAN